MPESIPRAARTLVLGLALAAGVAISTPGTVSISVQAGWETAITWVFAIGFLLLFGGGIYRTFRKRRLARAGGGDADTDRVPGHEASDGGVALAEVARHVGHRADGVHLGGEEDEQTCGEQEQTRRT